MKQLLNKISGHVWEVTEDQADHFLRCNPEEYELVDADTLLTSSGGGGNDSKLGGDNTDAPITPEMLEGMSHTELQKLASDMSLAKSGSKTDIIGRISAKLAELAGQ